jgi:ribosomal-protein-alanine N-acetyltransferase
LRYLVERMELEDISQVLEVDRESYPVPWPASAYRREILHNRNAHYYVVRELTGDELGEPEQDDQEERNRLPIPFLPWRRGEERPRPGRIVAYAGLWLVLDEAHVTTIAVREAKRGHGLGELMMASLVEAAMEMNADRITLEVRVTNEPAQNLYEKYGFSRRGVRARYYSDNNEDAYIMTAEEIRTQAYQERFDTNVALLRRRMERTGAGIESPVFSFPADVSRPGID